MVGRAGAGRLVLRAVSSAGAGSEGLLLIIGETGLGGTSDSALSFGATKAEPGARAGAGAGVFSGVGSAVVSDSSEAGPSLTLSWGGQG